MKKTMFATMTILSLFLSSCAQKEVKNEDKKEQSTEQNVKDSTKESKESVVKGMNQAPTSLVGNEKPNVVFAYMLQNQINGEIEMARVYYNEEYVILVFSVSENMLSLANINPKDVRHLFGSYSAEGNITYASNGDGTVTIYPVPSHWQQSADELNSEEFMTQFTQGILDHAETVTLPDGDPDMIRQILAVLK